MMAVGQRVREVAEPRLILGTVEKIIGREYGIRWDDHAARGFAPDELDLFGEGAAQRLLLRVTDADRIPLRGMS